MAGLRSLWCAVVRAGCVAAVLLVSPVAAQEGNAPILTIDQDRVFTESAFGRASLARERAAGKALEDENAAIEAELVAEEQDLTTRRKTTASDEFTALATAFDQKVEQIRTAQDAKAQGLARTRDVDKQTFRRAAGPIIGKLMRDLGAVVVIDRASVVLSSPVIDVTDEAISRIDAALGPGDIAPVADQIPEPSPEPSPEPTPEPSAEPSLGSPPDPSAGSPGTPKPTDPPVAP
jgi:Skp family chaperone for outer membrane proteins